MRVRDCAVSHHVQRQADRWSRVRRALNLDSAAAAAAADVDFPVADVDASVNVTSVNGAHVVAATHRSDQNAPDGIELISTMLRLMSPAMLVRFSTSDRRRICTDWLHIARLALSATSRVSVALSPVITCGCEQQLSVSSILHIRLWTWHF